MIAYSSETILQKIGEVFDYQFQSTHRRHLIFYPRPYVFSLITVLVTVTATACLEQNQPPIGYETPPAFRAGDLVSSDLLVGPHHQIGEAVTTDGFTNTYIIDSEFGSFYTHGNDRLPERIRKIYAIAGIRKTKESDAYQKALRGAAKDTVMVP